MPAATAGIFARAGVPVQPGQDEVTSAQTEDSVGLIVTATVGLDPDACASTGSLRVAPNTRVYYCYRAVNTGQVTLTTHTLNDTLSGLIWDRKSFELPPGASLTTIAAGQDLSSIAQQSNRNQVTWTASPVAATLVASATAETQVDVVSAGAAVSKTATTNAGVCARDTVAVVPEGQDAQFCIVIENTGDLPLIRHTLADPIQELTSTFDFVLAPSQRLTVSQGALAGLGIDGTLTRTVTQTLVNTVVYTGETPPDAAATGSATASGVASATVELAAASVIVTQTVGTDPAVCATTANLALTNPDSQLYFCAVVHNTGNISLTRHGLSQPRVNKVTAFTRTLVPGEVLSVTNTVLQDLGQATAFGPYTVREGSSFALNNTMNYSGTTTIQLGQSGETRNYTATYTASASASASVTPSPTATPTNTSRPSDSRPTNTPWPTPTWTWTPQTNQPTPDFGASQFPTNTPTPTRSYAISLLATPTSAFVSPLDTPDPLANAAATQSALGTLAAIDATSMAIAQSPLAAPAPTETPTATPLQMESPLLDVGAPTEALVIVVTNTPDAALVQRPIEYPTPTPTPDYLLAAARAMDAVMVTATWLWFLFGSLVFFVVAGVLVGLSFRQNERRRYELIDDGLWIDEAFLLPPPPPPPADEDLEDWPDSLP